MPIHLVINIIYLSLAANSHTIAKAFGEDPTVTKMVKTLAEKLIEKRTMDGAEFAAVLDCIECDANAILKKLHDKYYPLFSRSIKSKRISGTPSPADSQQV